MNKKQCIKNCLRKYGKDLDQKSITIILGCGLGSAFMLDFSGSAFMLCLAAGGVADLTVGLSVCLAKCFRNHWYHT
ncbi:hypothetical protein KFE80_08885 [bacterium SCSIO 12696]|nr:hypothetical protein KFE80_08885 [bacterium SCSIO 12696]